ncbi:hypothetical protein EVAR_70397_1 [Eumeta japonica]|uniref:Uncharacterized protein n=1 Tax=Eumeta variegata TaxID=151549 RepID=A0A4C1SPQ8_EUMVA|nr:hypothetical protein EVAR_70397_1 [Eumeta japonica]
MKLWSSIHQLTTLKIVQYMCNRYKCTGMAELHPLTLSSIAYIEKRAFDGGQFLVFPRLVRARERVKVGRQSALGSARRRARAGMVDLHHRTKLGYLAKVLDESENFVRLRGRRRIVSRAKRDASHVESGRARDAGAISPMTRAFSGTTATIASLYRSYHTRDRFSLREANAGVDDSRECEGVDSDVDLRFVTREALTHLILLLLFDIIRFKLLNTLVDVYLG